MTWQMTWGFIVLGVLLLAIFAWRQSRKVRILGPNDITFLGIGICMLILGLYELFFGPSDLMERLR